ncbi:uracil-DNA glycosylase family protein [Hyphococcus flavus]|uniref:Uracil-DNA glycosylase family protein n=1 Tax=Hyphococcus flavus TaxID=1866326 RepID=A0AAF0CE51_9PROT|nr:uracil-DNA glycosylase family protein [Hyphococcus flavus]WDI30716.1 uracil-DNA glycosylase family protein [Hyphococcus flavus]
MLRPLLKEIRACRVCVDAPASDPLPHEPRPVLQASKKARLGVFGQAPGNLVHQSGKPFTDPSGVRLREWMGVSEEVFYDKSKVAVIPMGFCFPGYDAKGGDLPPRKECATTWREELMAALPNLECAILVGAYAQKWHLGSSAEKTLTATVEKWREFAPRYFPTPHPSWRNNSWLRKNLWFESDLLPVLRNRVRALTR